MTNSPDRSSAGSAEVLALASELEYSVQPDFLRDVFLNRSERLLIVDALRHKGGATNALTGPVAQAVRMSHEAVEAGAQALADMVWHPSQPLESLGYRATEFRHQSHSVLKAAIAAQPPAAPVAPEKGWLKPALDKAERSAADMPEWMRRSSSELAAPVETRKTFTIPDGYETVRDGEGQATGEVRPVKTDDITESLNARQASINESMAERAKRCTYGNPDCPKCNPPEHSSAGSDADPEEYQRCMDMLGDVPGDTLEDRIERLISSHLELLSRDPPQTEQHSCPCGTGEEECPGPDGRPLCAVTRPQSRTGEA